MSNELKPCPFCGGEAEAYYVIDGSFACSCTSCSYASCAGFNTEQEAIEAWNRRAERTCKLVKSFEEPGFMKSAMEYECSECGGITNAQIFYESDEPRYCMMCGARVAKEE